MSAKKDRPVLRAVRSESSEAGLTAHTLARFRAGDPEAFAAVVEVYGTMVRNLVARYWRSIFDQEEAMQEVWTHVYRRRTALDPDRGDAFAGWLSTLARRRCIDLMRKAARGGQDPVVDDPDEPERLESAPEQQDAAENQALSEAVSAFTARLEGDWRDFFDMYFLEGLDYAEISERLSVNRARCKYLKKVLVARARKNPGILAALGRRRPAR